MPTLVFDGFFDTWRTHARQMLQQDQPPAQVQWHDLRLQGEPLPGLFPPEDGGCTPEALCSALPGVSVPKPFMPLAGTVAWHREPGKWPLLYRMLWRLTHGERELLCIEIDEDVRRAAEMAKDVRRDAHKMHAFVRFKEVPSPEDPDGLRYVAFHRPDHPIVRREVGFFQKRFPAMAWTILTPDESAHYDGRGSKAGVSFGPGSPPPESDSDGFTELWRAYYGSVFNPARANVRAMLTEMPKKHWATMPEARDIPDLLAAVPERLQRMRDNSMANADSAAPFLPEEQALPVLAQAVQGCKGCDLYHDATQAVFGRGPADARVMLVGEQPGDQEDQRGEPFIGPAGQVLDEVLQQVGLDRQTVYITNAVKHFRFEQRGKMRLHKSPTAKQAAACLPWLEAELAQVQPQVVVCLGATAAKRLIGSTFRITQEHGEFRRTRWSDLTLATYHPSAVLRARDPAGGDAIRATMIEDLTAVVQQLAA